ncbi:hypothetical protein D9M71_663740 [compost metagenome]
MVTGLGIGTTRCQDQVGTTLGQAAGQHRELVVVADQNAQAPQFRFEHLQPLACSDVPLLALEAGHHQFVLITQHTLGAEQPGTVAVAPIVVQHRHTARLQVDPPASGKALAQRFPGFDQRLDAGNRCLQVFPLPGIQLAAQHQPGVLRQ